MAAYAAALALADAAAWFSIRGMTVQFPGASGAVIVMAGTMDAAELITAAWFAKRWQVAAWLWPFALVTMVAGAGTINLRDYGAEPAVS